MAQQLKRWESPRQSGRNQKGRGGTARQRQLKKQHKRLLKRLKQGGDRPLTAQNNAQNMPPDTIPSTTKSIPIPSAIPPNVIPIQQSKRNNPQKGVTESVTPFLTLLKSPASTLADRMPSKANIQQS
ncbi:MAG: hypothetical protein HC857_03775 [Synechococcales cyanobacterium RU_4_20]|nr:hypothetical protein [Synechococcales cyanobacterium RU_4_20]